MEFFALSLLLMLPVGGLIAAAILFYLIYNRFKEKDQENFEKRSN